MFIPLEQINQTSRSCLKMSGLYGHSFIQVTLNLAAGEVVYESLNS